MQLLQQVQECHNCSLRKTRPVEGIGNIKNPKVMVVLEKPSDDDELCGSLYYSAPVRHLAKLLFSAGLVKGQIRFTYLTRCHPGRKCVPGKKQVGECSKWLEAEIAELKPQLIVPVGKLVSDYFSQSQHKHFAVAAAHKLFMQGQKNDFEIVQQLQAILSDKAVAN